MRKEYLVQNFKKGYKKAVAGTVTAALVVTSAFAYNAWADKEDTKSTSDTTKENTEEELKEKIKDAVNVESKDVDKDEIVYVMSDATGTVNKTIVSDRLINKDGSTTITDSSDLENIENVKGEETFTQNGNELTWNADGKDIYYQGTTTKEAPVSVKITYYLDGTEIAPEELAGQSGKVKIRFDYTNHETVKTEINGKEEEIYVPFVAVTGMILGDNFSNIEVTNGKSVSDGSNNVVVGYAMPGLAESLDIKEEDLDDASFPDFVEVMADVEDFSLEMTMTVVANNSEFHIDDIDLSDLDEDIDTLSDSANLLVDGSKELRDGVGTLKENLFPFQKGMTTLNTGIIDYTNGAKEIAKGIASMNNAIPSLSGGVKDIKTGVDAVYDNFGTKKESKTIRGGMNDLVDGTKELKNGAVSLKNGTSELLKGVTTLNNGASALSDGASALNTGVNQLAGAVNGLGTEIATKETAVYTKLAAAGISSYEEAVKALSDAKKLQTVLLQAIANDTYTGLAAYGVTDSVSAAKLLTDMTNKVNSLNEAVASLTVMDQVAAPLAEKAEDIQALVAGAKQVKEAAAQVAGGTKTVKDNVKLLNSGAGTLSAGIGTLNTGAGTLQSGIEALYTKAISPLHTGVGTLASNVPQLTSGVKKLYEGSKKLVGNNKKLVDGAAELKEGTDKISEGVDTLYDGAKELADGMEKFNQEGIQKLVDAYNGDVKSLVNRLNAVIHAGEDYRIFTQIAEGKTSAVKFIMKTDSVTK